MEEFIFKSIQKNLELASVKEIALAISLTDLCGHLLFFYKHPKAPLVSTELSQKKAYSSYAMKLDTKDIQKLTGPNKSLFQLETSLGGKIVSFPGGIYTPQLNSIGISAVGVSGSPDPDVDDTFAKTLSKDILQHFKEKSSHE